jgi:hypothetical protein
MHRTVPRYSLLASRPYSSRAACAPTIRRCTPIWRHAICSALKETFFWFRSAPGTSFVLSTITWRAAGAFSNGWTRAGGCRSSSRLGQSRDTHRNLQRLIPDQRWCIRPDLRPQDGLLPSFDDASSSGLQNLTKIADAFIARNGDVLIDLSQRLVDAGAVAHGREHR